MTTWHRPDHARELRASLVDVRGVLEALGFHAKKEGASFKVHCPWHEERTPSCSVQVKGGTLLAHCFGCGKGGDVLSLIAAARGLTLPRDFRAVLVEAACLSGRHDIAAELHGGTTGLLTPRPVSRPASRPPTSSPSPRPPLADDTFAAICTALSPLGHLDASPATDDVRRYLESRGLLEEAMSDGWFALPSSLDGQREWVQTVTTLVGEHATNGCGFIQHGAFTHPANRLAIPWRRPDGTIYTLQRRRIDDERRGKYVFPRERSVRWPYGIERLAKAATGRPIAFVEGSFDVLARYRLDRRTGAARLVLGIPGTDGWRSEWADIARGRIVYLATDADGAGHSAAQRWSADLYRAGAVRVIRLEPVGAKDWTELIGALDDN